MASEVNPENPEGGFLGRLRALALIAVVVGAASSVGLLLRAGQRTPRLLLVLMAIWVLSPFVALVFVSAVSKRWSTLTTVYGVMLVVVLASLAIYGDDSLGHRWERAGFVFVLVPPASWLLIAIAVSIAAFISGRLSRRGDGA